MQQLKCLQCTFTACLLTCYIVAVYTYHTSAAESEQMLQGSRPWLHTSQPDIIQEMAQQQWTNIYPL